MFVDRGYDFDKYRRLLWKRGIKPLIAGRGVARGSGLRKTRLVVGGPLPGSASSNGEACRYERRDSLHLGFLQLTGCVIGLRPFQARS